jgi:hypothetical protein
LQTFVVRFLPLLLLFWAVSLAASRCSRRTAAPSVDSVRNLRLHPCPVIDSLHPFEDYSKSLFSVSAAAEEIEQRGGSSDTPQVRHLVSAGRVYWEFKAFLAQEPQQASVLWGFRFTTTVSSRIIEVLFVKQSVIVLFKWEPGKRGSSTIKLTPGRCRWQK